MNAREVPKSAGMLVSDQRSEPMEIAVTGIGARLPSAHDLAEFWANLLAERSAIAVLPDRRWTSVVRQRRHDDIAQRTYWGGFIDDVDCFDAAFFNVSSREAAGMDPQQRMALEIAWEAIEDAGYSAARLAGSRTAVFMGVCHSDYVEIYEQEGSRIDSYYSTGVGYSIVANRISYVFDFRGASVVNDTACASSLVAVQQAVEALRSNECTLALAGGVNVCWSNNHYIAFTRNGMLSRDGKCKTFDASANGYVRGEGGGILVLKELQRARSDGDRIYGIIRGIGSNHGGRVNSLTATNPAAQAELIERVIRNSAIPPETISYIETHGTGTPLGDPIEIHGLQTAFRRLAETSNRDIAGWAKCGLGSVKTNIGHLEAAAGMAGMIKVLLSMRAKVLPATLNFEGLNSLIELENTPFFIASKQAAWNPELDGSPIPRRAGVSSFGFGGVNSHVLLEEYVEDEVEPESTDGRATRHCIVLSARTRTALLQRAVQLKNFLIRGECSDAQLRSLAYTLQVGRDSMSHRFGFVAASCVEVIAKLHSFVSAGASSSTIEEGDPAFRECANADVGWIVEAAAIQLHIENRDFERIVEIWVRGADVDWSRLYADTHVRRIGLPTYPFERKRFWVESGPRAKAGQPALHPLLHSNCSSLDGLAFESTFIGSEFFFADHLVGGRKVLPGVAHLEMAYAAVRESMQGRRWALSITDVTWLRQLVADETPKHIRIHLYPDTDTDIRFEIRDRANGDASQLFSQGRVRTVEDFIPAVVDLERLHARCNTAFADAARCYELFDAMGIRYGAGHRALKAVNVGTDLNGLPEVVARIELPESVRQSCDAFALHPSLLDAAFQTTMLFPMLANGAAADVPALTIPFALASAQIVSPCPSQLWAWVRFSEGSRPADVNQRLDLTLCDESGNPCIEMRGFTSRVLAESTRSDESSLTPFLLQPQWQSGSIDQDERGQRPAYGEHHVLLVGAFDERNLASLREVLPEPIVCRAIGRLSMGTPNGGLDERYRRSALDLLAILREIIAGKPSYRVLVQVVVGVEGDDDSNCCFAGLSGLLKTGQLEYPKVVAQCIQLPISLAPQVVAQILQTEAGQAADHEVRYRNARREIRQLTDIARVPESDVESPWPDGAYLITGGLGGLGLLVAMQIAKRTRGATLVLVGRAALTPDKQTELEKLVELGAAVDYRRVDVTDQDAVRELIKSISSKHGSLAGIVHCAGVIHDSFIVKKTGADACEVLAAKVRGLVNIDEATKDVRLKTFVLFSSVAAALGNLGQADYAAANAFMDEYAVYRNRLVARGERHGGTLSINWPLWADGGMRVDESVMTRMRRDGLVPLGSATGLAAMEQCLRVPGNPAQLIVMTGDRAQFDRTQWVAITKDRQIEKLKLEELGATDSPGETEPQLLSVLQTALIQMVAELLKVPTAEIGMADDLAEYGFDSISFTELTNQMNDFYRLRLAPTVFFEYPTLGGISEFLLREHRTEVTRRHDVARRDIRHESGTAAPHLATHARYTSTAASVWARHRGKESPVTSPLSESVAIVGVSCCFPQAADADSFWENLVSGKDCITEVPANRWDWRAIYGDPIEEVNRTDVKWGGFIDCIGEFDPQFFGISPREAEYMDPQQRLLLTHVWQAIEDAGYAPSDLAGTDTAVFFGLQGNDYIATADLSGSMIEGYSSTGRIPSVGPNRVSYFFDFHGPSEPIDTACSSALVAIHRAVKCLRAEDSKLAIAGGVNTIVRPDYHISFSKAGMLSKDGRCKTFSADANGYGRGEGIGVLVLKLLSAAERDGDHIYGLLRASGENHGGRANSLTAPNPNAQADLIRSTYSKSGIDPQTISYVETHGTGTPLGDPIEISGLKMAFKDVIASAETATPDARCGIGSVKTNIGHLEIAAGVAGVIKVLLQLKHRTLVKSLHCADVNPYIELAGSPFFIVRENQSWQTQPDVDGRALPRRAGVSSFGFGGVNAHVVIEEYVNVPKVDPSRETKYAGRRNLIVLSAKTRGQLNEQAKRLRSYVVAHRYADAELASIAYTLQVGRDGMDHRLAFAVETMAELQQKLDAYTADADGHSAEANGQWYRGEGRRTGAASSDVDADELLDGAIAEWVSSGEHDQLLALWVKGCGVDWTKLYSESAMRGNAVPKRISLPTYPFSREWYWLSESRRQSKARAPSPSPVVRQTIRPTPSQSAGGDKDVPDKPSGISLHNLSADAVHATGVAEQIAVSGSPSASLAPLAPDFGQASRLEPTESVRRSPSIETLEDELVESLAAALYTAPSGIRRDRPFVELGLDSIVGVEWIRAVNRKFGVSIPTTKLYDYPNIVAFARFLYEKHNVLGEASKQSRREATPPTSIGEILDELSQGILTTSGAEAMLRELGVQEIGLQEPAAVAQIGNRNCAAETTAPRAQDRASPSGSQESSMLEVPLRMQGNAVRPHASSSTPARTSI